MKHLKNYTALLLNAVLDFLHITRKVKMMNTLEIFRICNETNLDNQVNNKHSKTKHNVRGL